jgi:hypothetical protein
LCRKIEGNVDILQHDICRILSVSCGQTEQTEDEGMKQDDR